MKFKKTESDLKALLEYLVLEHSLGRELLKIKLKHSVEQDDYNKKDPRAFCHVARGENYIYCTQAIENVPVHVRLGLLLHEIAHIHLDAFDGDESEVPVDEFCAYKIPESGYRYLDQFVYFSPWDKAPIQAKNLEAVSGDFVYRISLLQD
jgi:hypothetical protein